MALSHSPGLEAIALGRKHGDGAEIERKLAGCVILIGFVHNEMQRSRQRTNAAKHFTPFHGIGSLTRESEKVIAARAFAATI
jgi:hypothetical protein